MQDRLSKSEFRSLLDVVEQRILDGERSVSEQLFEEFPLLASDAEPALEVIYREYAALEQVGEAPSFEELCQRFPDRRADLKDLFAVHEAIVSDGHGDESPAVGKIDAGTRIGNYKLLEEIGEGGFGVVYMAEQNEPVRRRVAIKIIKPGMDTRSAVARFEAERQALAIMDHPSICRVLDAGSTQCGHPYFVMELVHGMPITDYCHREKLSTERRLRLFRLVCGAVQHAHSKSIIHRDLKPSNVMVTLNDGEPVPKIIDFGISKALEHRLTDKTLFTRYGQMIGTPMYMSPEQADMSSLDVDIRSDVYSLGVLLYELLTGTTPFNAERMKSASFMDVVKIILEEDPPTPSSRVQTLQSARRAGPSVSVPPGQSQTLRGDLDHIVMKAVEKDRNRRYQTVYELSQDIERYLNREPVLASAPSLPYRLHKFVNRHRLLVASAVTILVGLLVGLSFALVGLRHARNEQAIAQAAQKGERQQRIRAEAEELAAKKARDEEQVQRRRVEANLYFQKVARAKGELDAEHLQNARILLAECSAEYRGWEWHYLDRLSQSDTQTLEGHTNQVTRARVSPDGKWIASCSSRWNSDLPGEIILWNFETGALVRLFGTREGGYRDICFSPDSRLLASASASGGVAIWEVESGRVLFQDTEHRSYSVAFAPHQPMLAAGGANGRIRLYDSDNGALIRELSHSFSSIHGIAFNPRTGELAAVCNSSRLSVWNPIEGAALFRESQCGDRAVVFSPDGEMLVTGGYYGIRYGRMRVFGFERGHWKEIDHRYTNFGTVGRMDFSPDSRLIAFQSNGNMIRLWDPKSGRQHAAFAAHDGSATSCAFSPDGCSMVTTGGDGKVRKWSISNVNTHSFETEHHLGFADAIDFSEHGSLLLVAGGLNIGKPSAGLKEAQIYQLSSGRTERRLIQRLQGFDEWMTDVRFGVDDALVFAAGASGGLHCWDAKSGESLWAVDAHDAPINCLAVAGDARIATGCDDGVLQIHTATGERLHKWDRFGETIHDVCFHPHEEVLFVAHGGGTLDVVDSHSGLSLFDKSAIQTDARCVAISREGDLLAVGSESGVINLYRIMMESVESTERRPKVELESIGRLVGHTQIIREMDFHPDGTRLASVSKDQRAIVWSVNEKLSALQLDPEGLNDHVLAIQFGSQGDQLAVTRGFEITIWNGAELGKDLPQELSTQGLERATVSWHRKMASQCERAGNPFDAAFHHSRILEEQPKDVNALRGRRDASASLGDWGAALKDADELCQFVEATMRDRLRLGLLHLRSGDTAKYQQVCRSALERFKDKANDSSTVNTLGWLCALGPSAIEEYDDAVLAVEHATLEARTNYAYWNTYGTLLLRAGRNPEALEAIWNGLDQTKNPDTPQDWLVLALANYRMGEVANAFEWFDRAAWVIDRALSEQSSERWSVKVGLRLLRDEVAEVLRSHLSESAEDDAGSWESDWLTMPDHERLMVLHHQEAYESSLRDNDVLSAREHAERLCRLRPESVDAWMTLASASAAGGDNARFEEACDAAMDVYGSQSGLLLSGSGLHVETTAIPFDTFEQFTIEAWVDQNWQRAICAQGFGGDPENSIWLATLANLPGFECTSVGWERERGRTESWTRLPRLREPWNHVALVFDGQSRRLYVNGLVCSEAEVQPPGELDRDRPFLVGAAVQGRTIASIGCIRSIRVSSTAKYTDEQFDPPELVPEVTTELLYQFSTSDREWLRTGQVRDLSDRHRDGSLRSVPRF
ncbi:MAG: protein kinase [Planctomycetota bacterium]